MSEGVETKQTCAEKGEKLDAAEYVTRILFFLYFIILTAERLYSIIASRQSVEMFGTGYNGFVYMTAILSIVAAYAYLVYADIRFFVAPFTRSKSVHDKVNMRVWCVAAGIILVSGMVHTEYTISALQFVAYGMLIAAMILRTVKTHAVSNNRVGLWLSLGYLIAFSMAIPVMYPTGIAELASLFYVAEAVTMLALVACFTFMLISVFDGVKAENLFLTVPIALVAVGDSVVIGLNWTDSINYFVLIFACLSVVLWIVGKILSVRRKTEKRNLKHSAE